MKENLKYNISSTNLKIAAFLGLILTYPRVNAGALNYKTANSEFSDCLCDMTAGACD